jgi:hypothetical protein
VSPFDSASVRTDADQGIGSGPTMSDGLNGTSSLVPGTRWCHTRDAQDAFLIHHRPRLVNATAFHALRVPLR